MPGKKIKVKRDACATKAGIIFSPARTLREMQALRLGVETKKSARAFLAAVLDTIATDLITAAEDVCDEKLIQATDLKEAIL